MKQRAQIAEKEIKWALWQLLSHWGTPYFHHSATLRLTEARAAFDEFEAVVQSELADNHPGKTGPVKETPPGGAPLE